MQSMVIAVYDKAYNYYRQGLFAEALQTVRKVHVLAPRWLQAQLLEAHIYRANKAVLSEIRILQAMLYPKFPIEMDAEMQAEAWSLLGAAYSFIGRNQDAKEAFLASAGTEINKEQQMVEYSNTIFVSNYFSTSVKDFQELYKSYCGLFADVTPYPLRFCSHRKLRIGYLSADFRQHPVAYFSAVLLEKFNRDRFEVYCYAFNAEDEVSIRFQRNVTRWKNVRDLSLVQLAACIYNDEIDILVDLSGHTSHTRLPVFFWQAAPVQISGIGYFNSTGLSCSDGFFSDIYCTKEVDGNNSFFVEPLLRLPATHFCYAPLRKMPPVGRVPSKENGYITFGCFNNFAKITDAMIRLWRSILMLVPESRLLLKHKIFDSQEGCEYVKGRLASLEIPIDRLILQGYTANYLEEYHRVDIALDTYPYTGGLTTFEALYMGVPVISLYGDRHGTRFGYSLLQNVGVSELAAATSEEYINKAVGLAQDEKLLELLHDNLRRMVIDSPLMDTEQYVKQMEKLYENIWQEKLRRKVGVI